MSAKLRRSLARSLLKQAIFLDRNPAVLAAISMPHEWNARFLLMLKDAGVDVFSHPSVWRYMTAQQRVKTALDLYPLDPATVLTSLYAMESAADSPVHWAALATLCVTLFCGGSAAVIPVIDTVSITRNAIRARHPLWYDSAGQPVEPTEDSLPASSEVAAAYAILKFLDEAIAEASHMLPLFPVADLLISGALRDATSSAPAPDGTRSPPRLAPLGDDLAACVDLYDIPYGVASDDAARREAVRQVSAGLAALETASVQREGNQSQWLQSLLQGPTALQSVLMPPLSASPPALGTVKESFAREADHGWPQVRLSLFSAPNTSPMEVRLLQKLAPWPQGVYSFRPLPLSAAMMVSHISCPRPVPFSAPLGTPPVTLERGNLTPRVGSLLLSWSQGPQDDLGFGSVVLMTSYCNHSKSGRRPARPLYSTWRGIVLNSPHQCENATRLSRLGDFHWEGEVPFARSPLADWPLFYGGPVPSRVYCVYEERVPGTRAPASGTMQSGWDHPFVIQEAVKTCDMDSMCKLGAAAMLPRGANIFALPHESGACYTGVAKEGDPGDDDASLDPSMLSSAQTALHAAEQLPPGTTRLVVSQLDDSVVRRVLSGEIDKSRIRIMHGFCQWIGSQLKQELVENNWLATTGADSSFVELRNIKPPPGEDDEPSVCPPELGVAADGSIEGAVHSTGSDSQTPSVSVVQVFRITDALADIVFAANPGSAMRSVQRTKHVLRAVQEQRAESRVAELIAPVPSEETDDAPVETSPVEEYASFEPKFLTTSWFPVTKAMTWAPLVHSLGPVFRPALRLFVSRYIRWNSRVASVTVTETELPHE